jgi:serine/threonine protein kinase
MGAAHSFPSDLSSFPSDLSSESFVVTESTDLPIGRQVDRYIIEGVVGRGGLAVVYRVRHAQLDSVHALKVLQIRSARITRRLHQEGRIQAALRHANLVPVTDMIDVDGVPGLVMDFVSGPTLQQLLAGGRPPPPDEVDRLAEGILAGVIKAHAHGVIHRDLKPGNILLEPTEDGYVPRVVDFGFLKVIRAEDEDHSLTRGGKLGTPRFMAPEQANDAKSVDARADVYSLGAILYELVTARPAFDALGEIDVAIAMRNEDYRDPREHARDLPDRWVEAIRGALKAERKARTPSAK